MLRRPIHERFYFTDGQFRALEFDSAATAEEVNIHTIGMHNHCSYF